MDTFIQLPLDTISYQNQINVFLGYIYIDFSENQTREFRDQIYCNQRFLYHPLESYIFTNTVDDPTIF